MKYVKIYNEDMRHSGVMDISAALDKKADIEYVNELIQAATATFRGTYNVVTDLSLAHNATHSQIEDALETKMAALSIVPDNNDYSFVQIPTSDETQTKIAKVEKYTYNGSEWAYEYELNNSGFTDAQWSAINSGATLELIGKLSALPTNAELTTLLNAKVSYDDNGAYDVSAHNSGATFASLSALLSNENIDTLIPAAVRKGGMSIRFVQTYDNKYVQFRLKKQTFSTTPSDWENVESSIKDIAEESCIRYIETGIRQDNNYYCQVSPLNPNKIYALKIKTSVDGEMTVWSCTANSASSRVDTIAIENFTAGVEKTIVGYKPTGAYPFLCMSTANEYTLDLYEYNNGKEIGESVDTAKVLKSCIEHEAEIQEWNVIPITGWLKKMIDTGTGTISTNTSLIEKVIHSDFFKAEGLCKLMLDSEYQIRLLVYSSTKVYESYSIITESTVLTLDGTKYYRINLVHGQAGAPGQASNISLSEFGHVRLYKIIKAPEYYKNLLLNTIDKSGISYIESGIRQDNNIYSQISKLDTDKIYALKITTAVDGTITVKAGTGASGGSMVDTVATEAFKANTPKMIYGYKPTGAYKFIGLSVANAYTLDLFEQVDGDDAYYQMNATDVIKSCLENESEMTGVSCIPITGWMKRFIDTVAGEISTNVNLVDKAIHSDFFKASGSCKLILDSGYQIRLLVYSSSKVYESFSIVTASGSLTFDSTKYYRINLIHGQAGAPGQAADISLSEFYHVRLYRYSANTSSNDTYNTRSKIYGIQINNSSATNNVSRIADAVGLKNDYVVGSTYQLNGGINDFDHIFPWCEMKLCNVKVVDGIKVITYAGETGFTRNGSNGDVMVEIPKFYSMRTVEGNLENICISGEKKSGFNLEPVFYDSETGKELDVIYCGAYLTETTGDVHSSKSGVCPTTGRSLLGFRGCGEMYDFSMVQALQKLISIEFGSVNLSHFLGGLGGLPYNETIKAYETISNTNTAVFYTKEVDDPGHGGTGIDYLFVGENITVSEYTSRKATRKITALGELITYDVNGETYHRRSVTFSGDAITVTADATYLYASAQDNGLADNVSYHTGKAGITTNNYVDQFKYRNIEGLWGNVGEMIDGIRLKDLEYYICNKKSDYNDITKYTKLSYHSVEQRQYNRKYSFITKMGFDRRYPNINLPVQISSNGSGDDTKFYGDILCALNNLSPSGESIPAGTEFIGINSLAWDGGVGNGPYMYRFWHTQTESQWLYGTRMIYRTL